MYEAQGQGDNEIIGSWRGSINTVEQLIRARIRRKYQAPSDEEELPDSDEGVVLSSGEGSASGSTSEESPQKACRRLRECCGKFYRWCQKRLSAPLMVALLILFGCFDYAKTIFGEVIFQNAFRMRSTPVGASVYESAVLEQGGRPSFMAVLVFINGISLILSATLSLVMEGCSSCRHIFAWQPLWRSFIVAYFFMMGQWLHWDAYGVGGSPILLKTLGYTYLPLSAVACFVVFGKEYGVLEWLSMTCVMLATMAVIFLRENCLAGSCSSITFAGLEWNVFLGCLSIMGAVVVSLLGSIFAERLFKDKSAGMLDIQGGHVETAFYIYKARFDWCGLTISLCAWLLPVRARDTLTRGVVPGADTWFGAHGLEGWDVWTWGFILASVGQWWMAGFVAKIYDTVTKALVQCCSAVIALMCIQYWMREIDTNFAEEAWLPTVCLLLIILIGCIIFQTGRINIKAVTQALTGSAELAKVRTISQMAAFLEDMYKSPSKRKRMADADFDGEPFKLTACDFFKKNAIIITYILADAARTELYSLSVGRSMLTPQTFTICLNACMLLLSIGLVVCQPPKGHRGIADLKESFLPYKLCKYIPCGFLFAITSSLTSMAYGLGLSAAMNVVVGKIYLPVCALASRYILGKFYLWIEWLAITLLTLDTVAFGALKSMGEGGGPPVPILAVVCCALSATFAALSSLVQQKVMTDELANGKSFMMQKLRSDFACLIWSIIFLPIMGWLANPEYFAKGAFWLYRPLTMLCDRNGACGSWDASHAVFTPSSSFGDFTCGKWANGTLVPRANDACTGCECGRGVFVAFNTFPVYGMLALSVFYGFVVGLVVTQFGTVMRAVADAFSLLLIYFVGDPIVQGTTLTNTALNMVALIVPAASQLFTAGANELKKVKDCIRKAEAGGDLEEERAKDKIVLSEEEERSEFESRSASSEE